MHSCRDRAAHGGRDSLPRLLVDRCICWQDLLLTEGLRVNRAVVVDSAIAVEEDTSSRPSTLTSNRADMLEELGEFHIAAPARLEHLLIGVSALNTGDGRMLEGGYAARATMTLTLVTNKGQRQKDYQFLAHLLPPQTPA